MSILYDKEGASMPEEAPYVYFKYGGLGHEEGWYFRTEDESEIGPYLTKVAASQGLQKYCDEYLR